MMFWEELFSADFVRAASGKNTVSKNYLTTDNYYYYDGPSELDLTQNGTIGDGNTACLHIRKERRGILFVLNYESFRNELDHLQTLKNKKLTRRCDLVFAMEDRVDSPFVVCEMTAMSEDSFDKKDPRTGSTKMEKAQEQLLYSIKTMYLSDALNAEIQTCPERVALFAVRIKEREIQSETIKKSAAAFMRPLKAQQAQSKNGRGVRFEVTELKEHGFEFYHLIYPAPFIL